MSLGWSQTNLIILIQMQMIAYHLLSKMLQFANSNPHNSLTAADPAVKQGHWPRAPILHWWFCFLTLLDHFFLEGRMSQAPPCTALTRHLHAFVLCTQCLLSLVYHSSVQIKPFRRQ
jgi:hypothetical protein